jgi:hypothetical protein
VSNALRAALAAVDRCIPPSSADEQLVVGAKVRGLMVGYDARWGGADWVIEGETERVVELPVINPATARTSRTWRQASKLDGVVRGYGKRLLLEHKSTSDDIADPAAVYWRRLSIDSQVSKYLLHAWQAGEKLDGALYDVIRKPGIRPKNLTKAEVGEIVHLGTYCGAAVAPELRQHVNDALERMPKAPYREDAALYAIRLAAETLAEPNKYYQRRSVPRLDADIVEYAEELWTIADEIRLARNAGRHFRNSSACMDWNRPCEYLGLCAGEDTPESERWRRTPDVHDELPGIQDGRDVLTNSRIKCFQLCRRKHYLRYEVGLRRVRDDDAEALFLGTVLHEALAAWWTQQKGEPDGAVTCAGSAVNAVAEPATAG